MTALAASPLALSIVVPCYKSADCLAALAERIETVLSPDAAAFELILVDDGSPDGRATWGKIRELAAVRPWIRGIQHRRNFGQDAAILTGLRASRGEYVVLMDDDLQHDPADIPRLLREISGNELDVVYAAFKTRKHKAWKQVGSWFNGKVAEWLIGKPRDIYLSSFKVVRGEVAREAARFSGAFPYVDPQILQITNRLGQIEVEHHDRFAGESNYSFQASVRRWARLAFSFSLKPLQISMWGGLISSAVGLLGALAVIVYRLAAPEGWQGSHAGWASIMTAILVFGGLQMVFIGILGEYVGRSHITVQQAPQSSVAARTYDDGDTAC